MVAVGVREIARDLGISPGNVSYHFPTKEALVSALIRESHAANNALAASPPAGEGFEQIDTIVRTIMRRDLENRWLLLDYVGFLVAFPELRSLHAETQRGREARIDRLVSKLVHDGLLDAGRIGRQLPRLRLQIFTQVFFWLPSAMLSAPDSDPSERLDLHARAALALFIPYCTTAGRLKLEALLDR